MTATSRPGRRRERRRGSLERPVNGRLYRSAFLVLSLPLLILAFSVVRAAPLPAPLLPPNFDGPATATLATDFAKLYPDRVPGSAGSIGAANWFRDALRPYGLPVTTDTWRQSVPGLGLVRLQNLWAVAAGQSTDAIVVMAHRDDVGTGPGVNDNATGTAALVELARGYGQASTPAAQRVRPAHTIVFLSTDAGSFGGLGAVRFAERMPFHVVATVNLTAIGGPGAPRLVITGDTPRSPAPTLVETAAKRILEQSGDRARRAGFLAQLIDLGFPYTPYEQGPFVARGIPAVTLTTAGERPPAAFTDRASGLRAGRLAALGRSAQELLGSLDGGLDLGQGPTSFVWVGDRIIRGWAVELLLFALLLPAFVVAIDLFAHCRRRRIPLLPAARSLRTRLAFWLFLGFAFYLFAALGAWPRGAPRPPNPATAASGDWPVLALCLLAALAFAAWLIARQRLVPRRRVGADERLAGETAALLALASSRCSFWQRTPSHSSSSCPRCTRGSGYPRSGAVVLPPARSSFSSVSSGPCSSSGRWRSGTSSASTRRGTCSSWCRSATCEFRRSRSHSRPPPVPPSSRPSPPAGTRPTPLPASGPHAVPSGS